jgi:hypothetical protein
MTRTADPKAMPANPTPRSADGPGGGGGGNVPVDVRLGRMPALWPGSAVFFADLYAIFYGEPEKTHQLQANVSGFFGYGGRLIPMLGLLYRGGDNLLILQEPVDPAPLAYFRDRLGLDLPAIEILDHNRFDTFHEGLAASPALMGRLKAHPARRLDGYVTDPPLERIAHRLGKDLVNTHAQSREANDKIALDRFLRTRGLPVFDGGDVETGAPLSARLKDLERQGYRRAVIRSSLGASGFGVATVDLGDTDPEDSLPEFLSREERVLVQGWIEPGVRGVTRVTSPSVQFFGTGAGTALFDLTGQLLRDASIHEGNVAPPLDLPGDAGVEAEIVAQSREVVQWVARTGYRGTGSIDFLVFERDGRAEVIVCEVNARVTGATYPSLIARHFLPGRAWLMRNFAFAPRLTCAEVLAALEREGVLFAPGRDEGLLPINFIRDDGGRVVKAQLLFLAGRPERCMAIIERCLNVLPAQGSYERD